MNCCWTLCFFLLFVQTRIWFVYSSALHPILGSCLPVSGCKLPSFAMPQDEESRPAYQSVQEAPECELSCLQATYCAMLLSCKTLQWYCMPSKRSFYLVYRFLFFSFKIFCVFWHGPKEIFFRFLSASIFVRNCKNNDVRRIVVQTWRWGEEWAWCPLVEVVVNLLKAKVRCFPMVCLIKTLC